MLFRSGAKPSVEDFKERVANRNLNNLTIWHNVGADVENGYWAMYGARLGTYLTMLEDWWDYRQVQNFDALAELWKNYEKADYIEQHFKDLGETLQTRLGLPIVDLDMQQSAFFKQHYKSNFKNQGIMIRE